MRVEGNLTLMHQSCLLSCFFNRWDLGLPWQFPGGASGKESANQCRRCEFDSWVGKIPWRRKRQPTPVFLPGEFHGQRRLVGYSPWGHKELDTTEHTHFTLLLWTQHFHCRGPTWVQSLVGQLRSHELCGWPKKMKIFKKKMEL